MVGQAIREWWEGSEPAVFWSPPPCDSMQYIEGGFVQVFRGGYGGFKVPAVDDGSHGHGAMPIDPPLYPLPPGDPFQDTPGGLGTGGVEFVVCQVCFKSCAGRCIPGRMVGSIGPCRRWKAGYEGSLDDAAALKAGTIEAMSGAPDWFSSIVEASFPGFLNGKCADLRK